MKIRIKGKEYEWGFDSVWGPMYLYEVVTDGKLPYDGGKTLCNHVLWWCILYQSNEGCDVSLDDWLQALNDLELVAKLATEFAQRMQALNDLAALEHAGKSQENDKKKA